jgi:hypothetical protein
MSSSGYPQIEYVSSFTSSIPALSFLKWISSNCRQPYVVTGKHDSNGSLCFGDQGALLWAVTEYTKEKWPSDFLSLNETG